MAANPRSSKVIAISLPAEMAQQVETIAQEEQRSVSELFREAFRGYRAARLRRLLKEANALAKMQAPDLQSEDDIERLVKATRAELEPTRAPKRERAPK